ncbi:hydantoinase/oxoprolinase family protein [Microbacterium sp. 1.5R]|uniref:hydantoinase/oxoprolinase family protein n=1 Tax=Microbacterium sp. 1.5R TaxID=1916917 RepID=UPI0016428113|nr:hydantoinase/oxoprolinase family protein [Microbacterium sp. 1.5R]
MSTATPPTLMVGVDVGGTFTDGIAIDADGSTRLAKVPTTPHNQAEGVLAVLRALDADPAEIRMLVHGTTAGTNALLERKGASTALITTEGFKDILELGRRERPQLYGMYGTTDPLVKRELRREVPERVDASGAVVTALDEEAFVRTVQELVDSGAESLLIGFLHSYANPAHERRAAQLAGEHWPNAYITATSDVVAEFREFERFGTGAINAYLQPVIDRYVGSLVGSLTDSGYDRELIIMQANGGMMTADVARTQSVNTVLSGPAAGAIAAKALGEVMGRPNIITADLGGTSFDVGMIVDGQPLVTNDRDIDYNVPVRIPTIDIRTIGAGGGSIAHVNAGGLLQVGPESAGARPGPIAYNRGGTEPTVTDANVILGRLPSSGLTGVEQDVDVEQIRAQIDRAVATPLGLSIEQAAEAILRVVNDNMAAATRLVSLERGFDPGDFALLGFGGAGPLHAVELADELNVPEVLIPHSPGILCAMGCQVAHVRQDYVQTISKRLSEVTAGELRAVTDRHAEVGTASVTAQGVEPGGVDVAHTAEMQYEGQTHSLFVDLAGIESTDQLGERLADAYRERYGVDLDGYVPRLVNVRSVISGDRGALDLRQLATVDAEPHADVERFVQSRRPVYFAGQWFDTPVYDRHALPSGLRIDGPAIFAQADSTTVLPPQWAAEADSWGNLRIQKKETIR